MNLLELSLISNNIHFVMKYLKQFLPIIYVISNNHDTIYFDNNKFYTSPIKNIIPSSNLVGSDMNLGMTDASYIIDSDSIHWI